MCTKRTMTRDGIVNIVKTEVANNSRGVRVFLTRKTCNDGQNRYAVVIRNRRTGRHTRLRTYPTIAEAFTLYKTIREM